MHGKVPGDDALEVSGHFASTRTLLGRGMRCIQLLTHTCFLYTTWNKHKSTVGRYGTQTSATEPEATWLERLTRTLSFYSTAVPLFILYRSLGDAIKLNNVSLGWKISSDELFDGLHDYGSDVIVEKIKDLKGYYIKTGQIISTRVDIFPSQYTTKLAITQDRLDPVSTDIIKNVVRRELLGGGELSELFQSFDEEPLGSASIAQVHRATLLNGRVVAVKVQRPGIRAKLMSDIRNLKLFSRALQRSLPIDYFKIFSELEKTLELELDFLHEAQATAKVAAAVAHAPNNRPQNPPVVVPLPMPGLVSTRVMVMEYIQGIPLSQLNEEMTRRGVVGGSLESKVLGRKLLTALTDAYASMIFGSGIIHGDPHPGNIFVMEGGEVCLLDCGQVKQLSTEQRLRLAALIIQVRQWEVLSEEVQRTTSAQRRAALQKEIAEQTGVLARAVKSFGM
jgi:aarF domain-containing kinase